MYTPNKTITPTMAVEEVKERLKELEQTKSQRTFRVNSVAVSSKNDTSSDISSVKVHRNTVFASSGVGVAQRTRLNSVVGTMGNYTALNKDLSDILQGYIKEISTEESAIEHIDVKKDKYHLFTALMDLINTACRTKSHPKDIATLIKKACQIHDDIEANKSVFGVSFSFSNLLKKVAPAETSEVKKVNIVLDPELVEAMKNRLTSAIKYSDTFNHKNRAGEVLSRALETVQTFESGNYQPTRMSLK